MAYQVFIWLWQENLSSDKERKKNTPLEREVIEEDFQDTNPFILKAGRDLKLLAILDKLL